MLFSSVLRCQSELRKTDGRGNDSDDLPAVLQARARYFSHQSRVPTTAKSEGISRIRRGSYSKH